MKSRVLLLLTLFMLTACGFHLRGSQSSTFNISNIYIDASNAPQLGREVKGRMKGAGVIVNESPANASYILTLKEERFEKSVLSVAADTGKVEEFLIKYSAKMDARDNDGKQLINNETINLARDYTFDETAVLGEFSENQLLRKDLVVRASSQVLRRLQTLTADSN